MNDARTPAPQSTRALRDRLAAMLPQRASRPRGESRCVAIEAGDRWARAIVCERGSGRITITRVASEATRPDAAVPALREMLGVAGAPCIVALPRQDAMLGLLELPTDDEAELRSMARMALVRDYGVEGVETLSDFQRVSSESGVTRILGASATRSRVDDASARAGAPVGRVSLRTLGMLALVRTSDAFRAGRTMVVDLSAAGLECTLIEQGAVVFTRGAALADASDDARHAASLVEIRRAFAALRAGSQSAPVDRVLLAGSASAATALLPQLAAVAQCSAIRLDSHPLVGFSSGDIREQACADCWPLAGLLLEDDAALDPAGHAIDILHPTPLIDVAARLRQRVLMVAGLMVVGALAGWTFGARSWRDFEAQHDDLLKKAQNASPVRNQYRRDELRVKHIEAYRALAPSWLAHFDALRRFAPDPSSVVLDSLTAQIDGTEIEWIEREGTASMQAKPELRFVLDGEAKDRPTADSLRDTLVREKSYTLSSSGADARGGRRLPYPFAYTLRTVDLEPKQPGAASTKTGGGS